MAGPGVQPTTVARCCQRSSSKTESQPLSANAASEPSLKGTLSDRTSEPPASLPGVRCYSVSILLYAKLAIELIPCDGKDVDVDRSAAPVTRVAVRVEEQVDAISIDAGTRIRCDRVAVSFDIQHGPHGDEAPVNCTGAIVKPQTRVAIQVVLAVEDRGASVRIGGGRHGVGAHGLEIQASGTDVIDLMHDRLDGLRLDNGRAHCLLGDLGHLDSLLEEAVLTHDADVTASDFHVRVFLVDPLICYS